MTDMRKLQNRVKFGEPEMEFRDTGKGFGMMGIEGSGSVRLTKSTKQTLKGPRRGIVLSWRSEGRTIGQGLWRACGGRGGRVWRQMYEA